MGTNLTQLKYDLSQNNGLAFVVFLIYEFRLSIATLYYVSSPGEKLSYFLFFNWFFPLKSIINSFLGIQFFQLLSRGKENINFCLLISFAHQVKFSLLISF